MEYNDNVKDAGIFWFKFFGCKTLYNIIIAL